MSIAKTNCDGSEHEADLRLLKLGDDDEVECVRDLKYLGVYCGGQGGVRKR